MSMLVAIYTLWLREMKHYFRARSRFLGSLATPIFWLAFVGIGLSSAFYPRYLDFMFPGIIGMTILFTSTFSGVSVLWDKQFGFMKEIFVAPISRVSIVLGKMLGGVSIAMLQGICILLFSKIFGIKILLHGVIPSLFFMFLISASYVCFGLIFAARMEDPHGFQIIVNFIVMPMFFLSGSLFPITKVPTWLKFLVCINPFTYGVDALRLCLIGEGAFSLTKDVLALLIFFILTLSLATYLFREMEA